MESYDLFNQFTKFKHVKYVNKTLIISSNHMTIIDLDDESESFHWVFLIFNLLTRNSKIFTRHY